MKANGSSHPQHWIPGGYIYSPHNGDTGTSGHAYWAHYHAGSWTTDHGQAWDELVWENGYPEPDRGFRAIVELAPTHTVGYYLPSGPEWLDNASAAMGYDMADCWASDRKSTRLNSSHALISYAGFCLKKKKKYWTK